MQHTMLLLAGSPGTGKSYLANLICHAIPNFFHETSIDGFKEQLYEKYGFDNEQEKKQLDDQAYVLFYQKIADLIAEGKSIIADYPFSYRQHDKLQQVASRYQYQIITITLTCNLNILYKRQQKRDLDPARHLGFIMNHYHAGDTLPDRSKMDIHKTKTEFAEFNRKRGYANFRLGKTIFLDVSDFAKVDYAHVIAQVTNWLQ